MEICWCSVSSLFLQPSKPCNADISIQGYNGSVNINGIARHSSHSSGPAGPTVTAVIDNRGIDSLYSPLSGYVIQDGCIPETFNPVIHLMLTLQTMKNQVSSLLWGTGMGKGKAIASLKSLLLGPYAHGGSLQRTSTYLVMSHDSNETTLTMKDNQLFLSAPKEGRSEHFKWMKSIFNGLFTRTGADMGFSYFYGKDSQDYTEVS